MLKPGDKVVMNDRYYLDEKNRGKVYTVASEPWNVCGKAVVNLEGKAGCYPVEWLDVMQESKAPEKIQEKTPEQIRQMLEYLTEDCKESDVCDDCAYSYECTNERLIPVPEAVITDIRALIDRLVTENEALNKENHAKDLLIAKTPLRRPLTLAELGQADKNAYVWEERRTGDKSCFNPVPALALCALIYLAEDSRFYDYGKTVRAWEDLPNETERDAAPWEV